MKQSRLRHINAHRLARLTAVAPLAAALGGATGGCWTGYEHDEAWFRDTIAQSASQELARAATAREPKTVQRESRVAALKIKPEFMDELDEMAGPEHLAHVDPPLGPSLVGEDQPVALVTLEDAVRAAFAHNLNLAFARLAPAIREQDVIAAEAAFDWTLIGNLDWSSTDEPRTSPSINGQTVGVSADQRQIVSASAGLRKSLTTGGQLTAQHVFTYTDNETPNLFNVPDPAHEAALLLQLDQPLLRNAGRAVTLSQVRLSENLQLDDIQALKAEMLSVVTDVETTYWALVRAHYNLRVLTESLRRGQDVYDTLVAREFDVRPSERSDAASTVEQRRADVIRAQRLLRDASDQLKVLMNMPDLPVGSEVLVLPVDVPVDEPITFSLFDSLRTAYVTRPEVYRSILSMDNTTIREVVAKNGLLPLLDLRAQTRVSSLADSTDDAYDTLDGRFVNYALSLAFEQPIRNRAARANLRKRRLEKMQAVLAYENTIQSVTAEVKAALREVVTNYLLIEQTRAFRLAATENLRTFLVEEETTGDLTPTRLDLKLRRQQSLASAEQQEIEAVTSYAASIARLHAAMGTSLERRGIEFVVPDEPTLRIEPPVFPQWDPMPEEQIEEGVDDATDEALDEAADEKGM